MYNLTLHIEYLLLRHECVVVPGIGAFLNVRYPASYDEAKGLWIPMRREVRFNGLLTHDDGLLANSYARKSRKDHHAGKELLHEDIQRLRDVLERDGEVTIGHLGVLCLKEDTLSFRPLYSPTQWAKMMGRENIGVHKKAEDKSKMPVVAPIEVIKAESPSIKEGIEKTQIDRSRNYYFGINKIFAKTVACLLVAMVVVLSLYLPGSNREHIDQASVVPVENIIRETVGNTASKPVDAASKPIETVSKAAEIETHVGKYHLIVGTFMTEKEARSYMQSLGETDYTLSLVSTPTRVRVSALSSDDRQQLQDVMTTAAFRTQFPQSWIWESEGKK